MRGLPKFDDPNLIIGPEGFSDAGAYRLRDDLLIIQSLDFFPPLVDDPFAYGQIAAANSMSDVYAMGGRPTTVLNIVGFPDDKLELEILGEILAGGAERVKTAGAVVAGGHTVRDVEIKFGLSVTGIVEPEHLMTNRGAKPGDVLVLTKPLGTGFVTTAFKANKCAEDILQTAVESMLQLNKIGSDAARAVGASAATDITGFGLAGHALEMAESSNVTLVLQVVDLPILPGVAEFVSAGHMTRASASNRQFAAPKTRIKDVDSLKLEVVFDAQTSGGLLISVAADRADDLIREVKSAGGIAAVIVGRVEPRGDKSLVIE